MSGGMRRIGEYLGLLEDTGRYDDEYGTYDEYETQETMPVSARPAKREGRPAPVSDLSERRRTSAPTSTVAGRDGALACRAETGIVSCVS